MVSRVYEARKSGTPEMVSGSILGINMRCRVHARAGGSYHEKAVGIFRVTRSGHDDFVLSKEVQCE